MKGNGKAENVLRGRIQGGSGINTHSATAGANHILAPETAYVKGKRVDGKLRKETLVVEANGEYKAPVGVVYDKVEVKLDLGITDQHIIPAGTKEIAANGTFDVSKYAEAKIAVPERVLTKLVVEQNGLYFPGEGLDGYYLVEVAIDAELKDGIVVNARDADGCMSEITIYGDVETKLFQSDTHLTKVTLADATSIGDYAFSGCTNLAEVVLPETLTSIGAEAFYNCDGLTAITIPANVKSVGNRAFQGASYLKEIYWNAIECETCGVSTAPPFVGCNNITLIKIADGVKLIPDYAFYNYQNTPAADVITEINIPDSVTSIGTRAFSNRGMETVTIPSSVASMGNSAFASCTNLRTVRYNVINQSDYGHSNSSPFDYCDGITNIYIGDGVTHIPSYLFYSNTVATEDKIANVYIPDSVTSIGAYAFRGRGMEVVTIPENVTSISVGAFTNCTNLATIYWNAINCTTASTGNNYVFRGCTSLSNIHIGDKVTAISAYAFNCYSNNTALKSLFIPDNVQTIGNYAFAKFTALETVQIGESAACAITTISSSAFNSDTAITSITVWVTADGVANKPWGATNSALNITWALEEV